jgi:hypothetical protein
MRFSSVRLLGLTTVTLWSMVQTPGMSHAVSFNFTIDTTSLATQPTPAILGGGKTDEDEVENGQRQA